jgi:DNA repair exonuclease SbcCD nuclease subunit
MTNHYPKYLFVGDPHYVVSEENDCRVLVEQIRQIAKEHLVDVVVWLGDLFHDHSLVRTEALSFWRQAFKSIPARQIVLVGNHDQPHDAKSAHKHALVGCDDLVDIVESPMTIDGVLFMPYMHDKEAFVAASQASDAKALVCHQTIEGARVGNEFFPDGVAATKLRQKEIISGHIHLQQELSLGEYRATYPGSPRWRDASDANVHKGLLLATKIDGCFVDRKFIPSKCEAIVKIAVTEGAPIPPPPTNAKVIYEISGTRSFVSSMAEKLSAPKVRVRTTIIESETPKVKETGNVTEEVTSFLEGFQSPNGTPVDVLKSEFMRLMYGN